jgi:hypothetical protein
VVERNVADAPSLTTNVRQENDMKIKASSWRLFTWIGSIPVIPIALFLVLRPDWGALSPALRVLSYLYISFIGGSGALVAILIRFGVIIFVYSPRDKKTKSYRMCRDCAALEKSIWGDIFSDKYYDTYLKEDGADFRTRAST